MPGHFFHEITVYNANIYKIHLNKIQALFPEKFQISFEFRPVCCNRVFIHSLYTDVYRMPGAAPCG